MGTIQYFCSVHKELWMATYLKFLCGGSFWTEQLIYSAPIFKQLKIRAVRRVNVYGASESELTMAQQFLDRCFKRRYISKKLEIGELLKVQDHRICRKVSSIPNHPLRANFPETKITRYNLRNKPPAMPAIHTDRFKNTFLNRIVFKYNVPL